MALVLAALWMNGPGDDDTERVAERLDGLKSEGTDGAVVAFDDPPYELLAELRRFDLAEAADTDPRARN